MQQQHPFFDSIATCGALEGIDQCPQGDIQPEHGILPVVFGVVKETVVDSALTDLFVDFRSVRHDHVVDPLERVPCHLGGFADNVKVLLETSFPVLLAELVEVLTLGNQRNDVTTNHP